MDIDLFLFLKKTLCLPFRFTEIFEFTCNFNFVLAKETEIVNSVNNKNNDINNVNSLNVVNNCWVNNFYGSFQIDAYNNNNTDYEISGDNCDSRKMNGYKSSTNAESLYLFLSLHWNQFPLKYYDQYWVLYLFSHTAYKSKYFVSYSANRQDPHDDFWKESSFSND